MRKIAIEEHFTTRAYETALRLRKGYSRVETSIGGENQDGVERMLPAPTSSRSLPPEQTARLLDVSAGRLAEMDEAGIDMQVLMLAGPIADEFDLPSATAMARDLNDELAEAVGKHRDRFAGFASLALGDPQGAAAEFERAVTKLGLKGAKITTHAGGEYLDQKKYWGFWETVEKLGMPIYIHPRVPPKGMSDLLGYRALGDAMWGYMADASLHAMRLMCGGVFDAYPKLKIILGHLGEGIPFWLWRMDNRWARGKANTPKRRPGEYFNDNFHVTTSGMFGEEAFACVYRILGAEKILFAVDYPYESSEEAVKFIEEAKIPDSDMEKICHSNAEKLFAL